MIKEAIGALIEGHSLNIEEAAQVMEEIMQGEVTPAQFGAFVTALRLKGETVDEIAGLASSMRARAIPVKIDGPLIDIVGTGGDNAGTFNISTAAAFVAAGAGFKVAKHGNRAMSSHCGSADVLEALGIKIDLGAEQVQKCIQEAGIGFMFAPLFHPAMKYAAAPRREIGIRTVFNILGPLTNPARVQYQVLGVPSEELGEKIALALLLLGIKHALVVHGLDGMDEISITGRSRIWEIAKNKELRDYQISPEDISLSRASADTIQGGTAEENAVILRNVLAGEKSPRRDVVLMNTAAALVAGEKAATIAEGTALAGEVIDNGNAMEKLEKLIELSRSLV